MGARIKGTAGIGELIKIGREEQGKSQKDFADFLGMTVEEFDHLESGEGVEDAGFLTVIVALRMVDKVLELGDKSKAPDLKELMAINHGEARRRFEVNDVLEQENRNLKEEIRNLKSQLNR